MKTLVVKFDNYAGKDYHYVVADDAKIVVGDCAVVHNGTDFRVVVSDILAGASSRATKTVVTLLTEDVMAEYKAENEEVKEQKDLFVRLEQLLAQESENSK